MGMGLGYLVGGALQGAGAGLAEQGEFNQKSRHEMAMEALRAKRQSENNIQQADLQDRNAANNDERDFRNATAKAGIDHKNRVAEEGVKFANDVSLEKLRSSLQSARSEAEIRLRDSLDSGEVQSTFEGEDGLLYTVRKDGSTSATGVKYRPKKSGSDDLLGLKDDDEPAPAPKPTEKSPPAGNVYTKTEYQQGLARYSMTKQGMPAAQIKAEWDALLRGKGYKLGAN